MSDFSEDIQIEEISTVKKKLLFDIPWASVKSELDDTYRKVGKTARIKGFRPGRIPREILERHYREQAEEEAITGLVRRYYLDAIQKKRIQPVAPPEIQQNGIEAEKNFTFSALVEIEPVIEPQDYMGMALEKGEPVVNDDEVQERLKEISQMFATMENIDEDREVRAGDFITIDFDGSLDGKHLKELKSEHFLLEIGSKTFVPGFEEQLVGARKGERKQITVRFPDDYHAEAIRGKDVAFTIDVKNIQLKKIPEIDEQFIKNFERYESLEALKGDIRKKLEDEKKQKIEVDIRKQIGERLLEKNVFEVPDYFVERQVYYMITSMQQRMVSGGMAPEKAAELSFNLREQFREEAVKIVKIALLLRSIAEKEGLPVGEEEIERRLRDVALQRAQNYETMRQSLDDDDLAEIKGELLNEKAYEFLEAHSKMTTAAKQEKEKAEEEK